jgi:hypothetical protein
MAPDLVDVESYERMEFDFNEETESGELDEDQARLSFHDWLWPWNDELLGGTEDPRNHFEFKDTYQNPFV